MARLKSGHGFLKLYVMVLPSHVIALSKAAWPVFL